MSEIVVSHNADLPIIEIINDELETIYESCSSKSFIVNPGAYLVRGRLPSGEMVSTTTRVTKGETNQVLLNFSTTSYQGLNIQLWGRSVEPSEGKIPQFPETWLRLWEGPNWEIVNVNEWFSKPHFDKAIAFYNYPIYLRSRQHLYLIQIGGPEVPWRFISVPNISGYANLLLWPAHTHTDLNGGISVRITSQNDVLEYLLQYIVSGSIESAKLIFQENIGDMKKYNEDLERYAEDLLCGKFEAPLPAAVAGYFLLKTGDLERLHNWPNNFANWIGWLPDAPVIHAWQLLRQPQPNIQVFEMAHSRLLQAVQRGLPVYTEGLRLLIDGLEIFADYSKGLTGDGGRQGILVNLTRTFQYLLQKIFEPLVKRAEDQEIKTAFQNMRVDTALQMIRRYAEAVDWSQPLTTYYGTHPNEPSLHPFTGIPENWVGLHSIRPD